MASRIPQVTVRQINYRRTISLATQANSNPTVHHPPSTVHKKIVALAGGVGGAKLAHGLAQILPPEDLTVIVNTGDDFEHLGLYHLSRPGYGLLHAGGAGKSRDRLGTCQPKRGMSLQTSKNSAGRTGFDLGDQDLATHLERTSSLKEGDPFQQITNDFCKAWGVEHTVLPMSRSALCGQWWRPTRANWHFRNILFTGGASRESKAFGLTESMSLQPAPGRVKRSSLPMRWSSARRIRGCSIDPILRVLKKNRVNLSYAVSPIIGGQDREGTRRPKCTRELGIEPSALAVAEPLPQIC
ncbi:MAG: 2-phospho-L-lactate transferase CofD family protein [Marinilabiliales bacterium]|nr:2-phospho-L-lactate transferase CofD family protein [Marinilabiliales bacterium]